MISVIEAIKKDISRGKNITDILTTYEKDSYDLSNIFESLCLELKIKDVFKVLQFYAVKHIPVPTPSKKVMFRLICAVVSQSELSFSVQAWFLVHLTYLENNTQNQFNIFLNFIRNALPDGEFTATLLKLLFQDIKNYSTLNKKNFDFKYIGVGSSKIVFYSSGYVISLGEKDIYQEVDTHELYNERIFSYPNSNNGLKIVISPYQEMLTDQDEEVVHEVFEKFYDEDITWFDIKPQNLGRYYDDFTNPFKNASNLGKRFLGIDDVIMKERKKGEVSVVDQSYIVYNSSSKWSIIHMQAYQNQPWYTSCYDECQKKLLKK